MYYLSGIHALNLPCKLNTCGDWHLSSLQWSNLPLLNSENSLFGDYGIEKNKIIPEHTNHFNVANHIRALLDLLEQGKFAIAQGMNKDFICNDEYTEEIFSKVVLLKTNSNWNEIDIFMGKEYFAKWLAFQKLTKL